MCIVFLQNSVDYVGVGVDVTMFVIVQLVEYQSQYYFSIPQYWVLSVKPFFFGIQYWLLNELFVFVLILWKRKKTLRKCTSFRNDLHFILVEIRFLNFSTSVKNSLTSSRN